MWPPRAIAIRKKPVHKASLTVTLGSVRKDDPPARSASLVQIGSSSRSLVLTGVVSEMI